MIQTSLSLLNGSTQLLFCYFSVWDWKVIQCKSIKSSQSFTQEPSGASATSALGAAGGGSVGAAGSADGGSEVTTGGWEGETPGGDEVPGFSSSSSADSS